MRRRGVLGALTGLGFASCPICAEVARAAGGAHWTYEGEHGPEHWGELSPEASVCSIGRQQSPIDITGALKGELGELGIKWTPTASTVVNNGHTIQVDVAAGSTVALEGKTFALKQFHFHHPSEHALNGKRSEMEVHFVHVGDGGDLTVLGMFIKGGSAHGAIGEIWRNMPTSEGKKPLPTPVDPTSFLPGKRNFYRYAGSLTTPPCAEVVNWVVFANPIFANIDQIQTFATLFPNNARPIQQRNRRFLLTNG